MISIQEIVVLFVDHVSSPVIMLLRILLSLSAVSMRSSEMFICVSFYSGISIRGTES
jgi:hypothetical protein